MFREEDYWPVDGQRGFLAKEQALDDKIIEDFKRLLHDRIMAMSNLNIIKSSSCFYSQEVKRSYLSSIEENNALLGNKLLRASLDLVARFPDWDCTYIVLEPYAKVEVHLIPKGTWQHFYSTLLVKDIPDLIQRGEL